MRTPGDAAVFAVVVVVAGGVREEVQRAFLLRRFERWLGGATSGVVVASAAFGAGHSLQGADAMIATGAARRVLGRRLLRRRRSSRRWSATPASTCCSSRSSSSSTAESAS